MKKIILAIGLVVTMTGTNSCSKPEEQAVNSNNSRYEQAMTLAPPTPGEMHNAVMAEYEATYGLTEFTPPMTFTQDETVVSRANQIMIDQGILTGTDEETATNEAMQFYIDLGSYNPNNTLKSMSEIISILLNSMTNSTIKAAHVNIINYTGSDFLGYANSQFDNLLSSSALTTIEKTMIQGSKEIFNSSLAFWDDKFEVSTRKDLQAVMDEIGYTIGFFKAWQAGMSDGVCVSFGLYHGARMSLRAAYM